MSCWIRDLSNESQLRWVGPEKGVTALATAAIVNAFWDLWGKLEGKPVWKLLLDMTPQKLASLIDFRYAVIGASNFGLGKLPWYAESKRVNLIRKKMQHSSKGHNCGSLTQLEQNPLLTHFTY